VVLRVVPVEITILPADARIVGELVEVDGDGREQAMLQLSPIQREVEPVPTGRPSGRLTARGEPRVALR
jgi:hypothetical protein